MLYASEGLTFGLRPNALGLRTGPHPTQTPGKVNPPPLVSFSFVYFPDPIVNLVPQRTLLC